MPKESIMEIYIKEKAKRNEIINYDDINGNFKKCEFCNGLFHPRGFYKHQIYCKLNPNKKKTYGTKRKWHCRFCSLIFKYNKERNLHETRCTENLQVIIINSRMSNYDKLELCKMEFPEIYKLLTINQIKTFLELKTADIEKRSKK